MPLLSPPLFFLGQQDERGPCARAIEQFRGASLLSQLQGGEERAQVMAQVMAELATIPHLQRGSQEDDKLVGFHFQRLFWLLQAEGQSRKGQCSSVLPPCWEMGL